MAMVAAQHGQRDEDLPRVGDATAVPEIAEMTRDSHQLLEALATGIQERLDLIEGERFAASRPCQSSVKLVGPVGHGGLECTARPGLAANKRKIAP